MVLCIFCVTTAYAADDDILFKRSRGKSIFGELGRLISAPMAIALRFVPEQVRSLASLKAVKTYATPIQTKTYVNLKTGLDEKVIMRGNCQTSAIRDLANRLGVRAEGIQIVKSEFMHAWATCDIPCSARSETWKIVLGYGDNVYSYEGVDSYSLGVLKVSTATYIGTESRLSYFTFPKLDTDHNGVISQNEIIAAVLGWGRNRANQTNVADYDFNGDGTLTAMDWLEIKRVAISDTVNSGNVFTAVNMIDSNKDGVISAGEAKAAVIGLYEAFMKEPGNGYDATYDFNSSGTVSLSDLSALSNVLYAPSVGLGQYMQVGSVNWAENDMAQRFGVNKDAIHLIDLTPAEGDGALAAFTFKIDGRVQAYQYLIDRTSGTISQYQIITEWGHVRTIDIYDGAGRFIERQTIVPTNLASKEEMSQASILLGPTVAWGITETPPPGTCDGQTISYFYDAQGGFLGQHVTGGIAAFDSWYHPDAMGGLIEIPVTQAKIAAALVFHLDPLDLMVSDYRNGVVTLRVAGDSKLYQVIFADGAIRGLKLIEDYGNVCRMITTYDSAGNFIERLEIVDLGSGRKHIESSDEYWNVLLVQEVTTVGMQTTVDTYMPTDYGCVFANRRVIDQIGNNIQKIRVYSSASSDPNNLIEAKIVITDGDTTTTYRYSDSECTILGIVEKVTKEGAKTTIETYYPDPYSENLILADKKIAVSSNCDSNGNAQRQEITTFITDVNGNLSVESFKIVDNKEFDSQGNVLSQTILTYDREGGTLIEAVEISNVGYDQYGRVLSYNSDTSGTTPGGMSTIVLFGPITIPGQPAYNRNGEEVATTNVPSAPAANPAAQMVTDASTAVTTVVMAPVVILNDVLERLSVQKAVAAQRRDLPPGVSVYGTMVKEVKFEEIAK